MAFSSPLSEPPSSLPRTQVRDRLRKRGSFDPSTPRMVRRFRSVSRESPQTPRQPGGVASKGKEKEVEIHQTPNNLDMTVQEMISYYARKRNVRCDADDDIGSDDDDKYEDASEPEVDSPTPGEKYAGPSTRDGQKTLRSADRQWMALESEDVYAALSAALIGIAVLNKLNTGRIAKLHLQRPKLDNFLATITTQGKGTDEAIKRLTTIAANQLNALTSKVDLLVKSRNQDALERKVEELSGQLVSLAQRSR